MKIAPVLVVIASLVLPLTWLSLRSADEDAERFDQALAELDRFGTLQAALHRDVLNGRVGMLRNYDPLARDTRALDDSLRLLGSMLAAYLDARAALAELAASLERQEDLVEHFKTNNALLQNSLAYFSLFAAQQGNALGSLTPAVGALAAAMLRLTLDTSPATARDVQSRLEDLSREAASAAEGETVQVLLAHGALLHDLLPATDAILRQFDALPESSDGLRHAIVDLQSASRARARDYRRLLYFASLVLSGLLAYLALELQARARALRRRAAFEHAVAGISLELINAPEGDLDGLFGRALGEMARCVDADRAYLLIGGEGGKSFTWCGPEPGFPPGWPARAPALLDRFPVGSDGTLLIPRVSRLPQGPDRAALAAAGLQGWACVSRRGRTGDGSLLGFDTLGRPCRVMPTGELGVMWMALDALASAFDRRTLAQDRSRLTARLEQARRLETVGALASGVAHNFNNIVGAILGYTEMAGEQAIGDRRTARIFADIQRAGERGRELVDQVLSFARRRDTPHSRVDLHSLVSEAESLLRASLPATVELVVGRGDDPLSVSGVPTQLQQVILNLCNNAAQSMGYAGRIELEIAPAELSLTLALAHGVLSPGHYVRIAVSDRGRGIDKDSLERIFEPFFTTRPTGSGLGLATSREIVREHGGAMHVLSTVGVGSRFEVWLPRADMAVPVEASPGSTGGHGETILLVVADEQQLLRDEEMLAALGYEPVGFASAAEACQACRAAPGRFDLAVIGYLGSERSVLDGAAALHEIAPALPILAASGPGNAFDADGLVAAGIRDVIPWPLAAAEIAAAIGECLRRRGQAGTPALKRRGAAGRHA